ncbi:hypothetical protein AAH991_30490 [Microbispora sp. ZYX-F-249]|uniref:Uncharacterized protein n=1 Tax=Microbispora maris TaxID=3144104 RepID=A0ABV0AW30_9ACTN
MAPKAEERPRTATATGPADLVDRFLATAATGLATGVSMTPTAAEPSPP